MVKQYLAVRLVCVMLFLIILVSSVQAINITRSFSSTNYTLGSPLNVKLTIKINASEKIINYGIQESIPSGWQIYSINTSDFYRTFSNSIFWIVNSSNESVFLGNKEINYVIIPNSSSGTKSFSGFSLFTSLVSGNDVQVPFSVAGVSSISVSQNSSNTTNQTTNPPGNSGNNGNSGSGGGGGGGGGKGGSGKGPKSSTSNAGAITSSNESSNSSLYSSVTGYVNKLITGVTESQENASSEGVSAQTSQIKKANKIVVIALFVLAIFIVSFIFIKYLKRRANVRYTDF